MIKKLLRFALVLKLSNAMDSKPKISGSVIICSLMLLAKTIFISAFLPPPSIFLASTRTSSTSFFLRSSPITPFALRQAVNNDNEDESISSDENKLGDQFIKALIDNANPTTSTFNSPSNQYTHMIAIPLEQNHDLLLELESVQRGVLYHCPLLINACIMPVMTRLPLLLVDTTPTTGPSDSACNNASGQEEWDIRKGGNIFQSGRQRLEQQNAMPASTEDMLTSRDPSTQQLYQIVNDVVQEYMYVPPDYSSETAEERERRERNEGRNGVNDEEGVKPCLISFRGLELEDGVAITNNDDDSSDKTKKKRPNEVLYAIGEEGEGTKVLRTVIMEIQRRIEGLGMGWRTALPMDDPQGGGLKQSNNSDGEYHEWRPRIPFMRLPLDFEETLPDPKGLDGKWKDYSAEEKSNYIRFPEEGGNGISPIFWYNWVEDSFCNGEGIRYVNLLF